jgi:hypothetical protein
MGGRPLSRSLSVWSQGAPVVMAWLLSMVPAAAGTPIGYSVTYPANWTTGTSTDSPSASSFTTGASPVTFNVISLYVKDDGTVAIYSDVTGGVRRGP